MLKRTVWPATGFPATSMTFATTSAGGAPSTSLLGIDWGFAVSTIATGSLLAKVSTTDVVTDEFRTDVAVMVIIPAAFRGP